MQEVASIVHPFTAVVSSLGLYLTNSMKMNVPLNWQMFTSGATIQLRPGPSTLPSVEQIEHSVYTHCLSASMG